MKKFILIWRRKLQENKLSGYLNICRKANYLIIGRDKLENYNKKLFLVLYDIKAGKSTLKIAQASKNKGIMTIAIEKLGTLVGIENCKIIAIKNKQLSQIIEKLCEEKE